MPIRTIRQLVVSVLPALVVACSASSGDNASPPDAGGSHPDPPDAGNLGTGDGSSSGFSSGSSGGGSGGVVPSPSDDSGGAPSPDAVAGSGSVDDAGADDAAANARAESGAGDATADARTTSPGDASVMGDGGGAPLTVYLAGDSTVSQYTLDPNNPKSWAGWGQMLAPHFNTKVTVVDAALGGRTAHRFILEGHLAAILSTIKAGDYLLVQFGTNDSNMTATYVLNGVTYPYYAPADTEFKTYLQMYIDGASMKGAIPVLVTPPPRNSAYCGGGQSLLNYGQAMIALGTADKVAVVDLGAKAHAYLTAICPAPTSAAQETVFKLDPTKPNGIDGTHFQENGARLLANFVADGITEDGLGLAAYRIK